jgi:RNA polymerase sigma factor (sigma-70 family)
MQFFKRFRKPRPVTDAEFVAAYYNTGNLDLLAELYERHIDMVYAVCFKYLRHDEDSQDAVMALFEQLITDLRRHEVTNFKSWLHSVARNYCLMHLRSQNHHELADISDLALAEDEPQTSTRLVADYDTDHDDRLDLEHNLTQLEACLKTLPVEQQTCLDLFYFHEKTYADIATMTGYDPARIRSYLQNGRRQLKNCLTANKPKP